MRKRVYIETTIVSYLTARPSRNLLRAAHQRITQTWWEQHRHRHDLFVSQFVLDEAADGDPGAAVRRLLSVRGIPVLADSREARSMARALVEHGLLPKVAGIDALHLALAAVHEMDVVLTWNCRHLANAAILGDIGRLVRMNDYEMPIVCTPEELMDDEGREHD